VKTYKIRVWWYGLNAPPNQWQYWRNYWEFKSFTNALMRQNIGVAWDYEEPDIDFLMWGMDHFNDLTAKRKFAWLEDHGAFAMQQDWSDFEHVWVRSYPFHDKFKEVCPQSSVILGTPTVMNFVERKDPPKYDLVFLGSATPRRVDFLKYLIKRYSIGVAGSLVNVLPAGKFGNEGFHFPNHKLGEFFNMGYIFPFLMGDPDYIRNGFISSSVYDMAATSECLLLHENGPGFRDIFSEAPTFDSYDEAVENIDYYLSHKREMEKIVMKSRAEALQFTDDIAVEKMKPYFEWEK
jgi:hypothetical protein